MATLTKQPVRAEITIGTERKVITIRTPNVVSFSVARSRGQMTATFNASIKVPYDDIAGSTSLLAERIVIKAGASNDFRNLNTIFTGKIFNCVVNPIRTDASKVMLNISGKDVMHVMEGQKVTRRLKTYRHGETPPERWGMINQITKHHTPKTQRFPDKLYTKAPVVVRELQSTYKVETAPAFGDVSNEPVRTRNIKNRGQLAATKEYNIND